MASNYWLGSHANSHILTRHALRNSPGRSTDLQYATEREISWLLLWSAGVIGRIGKKLNCRQIVIATAIVYFRRFYTKNAFSETDPCIVAAACVYVATKCEEAPSHVKTVCDAARYVFGDTPALGQFTNDQSVVAEMEFYLISDLDFHLMVWHPYRDLSIFCGKEDAGLPPDGQVHCAEWLPKLGTPGSHEYVKQLMRKQEMMGLDDDSLRCAWAIVNDTYRTDLCLLYPPYLIALAAAYITIVMNPPLSMRTIVPLPARPTTTTIAPNPASQSTTSPSTSTSASTSASNPTRLRHPASKPPEPLNPYPPTTLEIGKDKDKRLCPIEFFARLPTSMALVLEVVQEIVALYDLWNQLEMPMPLHHAQGHGQGQGQGGGLGGGSKSFFPYGSSAGDTVVGGSSTGMKSKGGAEGAEERCIAVLLRMRRDRAEKID